MENGAFGVALDPMRPGDILKAFGAIPPSCPNHKIFLESVGVNNKEDIRFECLSGCGYEAIWRKATDSYERPNWWDASKEWVTPLTNKKKTRIERKPIPASVQIISPETTQTHVDSSEKVASTDPILSVLDAGLLLGLTPSQALAAVKSGTLKSEKDANGKIVVRESTLLEYGKEGK